MAALNWGAATDAGRVRDENEDAFVAEAMVFVVADGMGGHQAGEVASALAVTTLRERLHDGATSADVVVAAVVEANAAIFQTAHNNAEQRGMGTTLTAMAVLPASDARPEQLALVNVGDSRGYLWRRGELTRATVDHSYVQELLATGHITEVEARSHPRRNIITRALGIEPSVRVDAWVLPLVRADRFMLCSDGLVDEVDDEHILDIMLDHADPQAAAEALVAAAVANGGRDNVTVIVIDVLDGLNPDDYLAGIAEDDLDDEPLEHSRRLSDADPLPTTEELPVTPTNMQRRLGRQLSAGMFLVFLAIAIALAVIGTLVAVAITNSASDTPVSTTTSTSSTTSSSSSTTSSTSTTVPTSTTVSGGGTTNPSP
ncbi:MAG: hypothetical protein RLZZ623_277 [Actinomycetota bacterium]|jgi:PPM family protein phosphatase